MSSVRSISTAEVIDALGRARPLDAGSGPWTVRFIELADRQFGGRWRWITLTGPEALEIVLPPHAGEPCRGDRLSLVTGGGARVRDAAFRLRAISDDYARANPSCWARINAASTEPFSSLILTPAPLDSDDHGSLPVVPGALYHLDGFHRLLGWALARRLGAESRLQALLPVSVNG